MSNENEAKLKEAAYQNAKVAEQRGWPATGGILGCDPGFDHPMREVLRRRVEERIGRVEREQMKATRLYELRELLAKHPDVARILELIEETQ